MSAEGKEMPERPTRWDGKLDLTAQVYQRLRSLDSMRISHWKKMSGKLMLLFHAFELENLDTDPESHQGLVHRHRHRCHRCRPHFQCRLLLHPVRGHLQHLHRQDRRLAHPLHSQSYR